VMKEDDTCAPCGKAHGVLGVGGGRGRANVGLRANRGVGVEGERAFQLLP